MATRNPLRQPPHPRRPARSLKWLERNQGKRHRSPWYVGNVVTSNISASVAKAGISDMGQDAESIQAKNVRAAVRHVRTGGG